MLEKQDKITQLQKAAGKLQVQLSNSKKELSEQKEQFAKEKMELEWQLDFEK